MVEEVVAAVRPDEYRADLTVRWRGGTIAELAVDLPRRWRGGTIAELAVDLPRRWRGGTIAELAVDLPRFCTPSIRTDEDTVHLLRRLAAD